jgi:ankyrin repeat protein
MSKEFFDAIKQGNLDKVQQLLSLNPSLIHERDDSLSPVMVAVHNHKPKIVDFLSEKTGTLNIFESAATGKTNQVIRHLARDPLLTNTYTCDGFQPLGLACFFGHHETAEYLIKVGALVNSPSRNLLGATPIHLAATAGHIDIVMLLLLNNANPNAQDNNGCTPLHNAAESGNTHLLRLLLFNGADMAIRNRDGKSPTDLAIKAGHTEAETLLKEGITRRFRAYHLSPTKY